MRKLITWTVSVSSMLFCFSAVHADERPNILFVFTDDHACHAIGAYGGWLKDVAPTPNIDQLARDGVLFENSFCTNSICGPSRAVILTGKHSHLNGFRRNGDNFDSSQQTFPKLLQAAGYQTAVIGKWHLKSDPTGFDYWHVLRGQGKYYNPDLLCPRGRQRFEGYSTDIVTDQAIGWLKNHRDDKKPFVLMCQHKAPHRNWMPALRHLSMFDGEDLPEAVTLFDEHLDDASPARQEEMSIDEHLTLGLDLKVEIPEGSDLDPGPYGTAEENLQRMTPAQREAWDAAYGPKNEAFLSANLDGKDLVRWKYQRYLKDYLRCIKAVDESVGKLRQALEDLGLAENTIVIYSSDQGFFLGDHGWFDKRWMYEESLKMPLIVHWPGVTGPQQREEKLVQNLDYAPTFLDMAGCEIPADMQGQSLVPLLRGEEPTNWRDSIYYHYYEYPDWHMVARHNGVRTDRYKLIHFYQTGEWEFYDLENDPDELQNEIANPRYVDAIAEMKAELEALKRQYQDDTETAVSAED